ncbi:MAG: sugar ABC transporter permease [SAR324 cluster bacterium]|nr:sugar ABC transporter permease [SAR324 cluster bacterium]
MLIVLGSVAIFPLYRTFLFSFTDAKIDDLINFSFIGFNNYIEKFEGLYYGILADSTWWNAVYNTLFFTVISVTLETILGLIVALCLHRAFKGRGIFRAIMLIPWAIPTVVSAKMWSWMLNDQFGIINDMLLKVGIISESVAWTSNSDTVMWVVIFVDVWKTTPFMALLILAGLQIIPGHIFQAAKVDGISGIRLFFKVILPLLRPTLIVSVVFRALDALRIFDLIYVLTPSNDDTISMSVYARENLFDFDKFGYGSAASTLLFLVICMLTLSYLGFMRLTSEKI